MCTFQKQNCCIPLRTISVFHPERIQGIWWHGNRRDTRIHGLLWDTASEPLLSQCHQVLEPPKRSFSHGDRALQCGGIALSVLGNINNYYYLCQSQPYLKALKGKDFWYSEGLDTNTKWLQTVLKNLRQELKLNWLSTLKALPHSKKYYYYYQYLFCFFYAHKASNY